jgi:hypothetical protein
MERRKKPGNMISEYSNTIQHFMESEENESSVADLRRRL